MMSPFTQPPQRHWYASQGAFRTQTHIQALCEAVARAIAPDERVWGIFDLSLDSSVPDRIPRRYRAPKQLDRTWLDRRLIRVLFWPVSIVFGVIGFVTEGIADLFLDGLFRIFSGRGWSGGWDTTAGHFVIATRTGNPHQEGYENKFVSAALTDRQLLLLYHQEARRNPRPAGVLLRIPRRDFRLRREPEQRGVRVDVAFRDGSWVGLHSSELPNLLPLLR